MDNDIIATTEDVVSAGMCLLGLRTWARARDWDFQSLVKDGKTVKELRELGCPYADRVADAAERRVAGGAA